LDYFLARYYSSTQGRFTSPDEFSGGPDELYDFAEDASANPTFYAELDNPQSLNKYQYTYNNPLNMVDSDGHCPDGAAGVLCRVAPVVVTIPGLREAAGGAAAVLILAVAMDAIPGDKTAGDGSCPSCERALKAGQQRMEQQEKHKRTQQLGESAQGGARGQKTAEKTESQDFTPSDKRKIDAKTGGRCADCGRDTMPVQNKKGVPTPSDQRQRHHDKPKKDGGTRDVRNGVPLCPECHKERHRKIREERKRQE
jgi:RHS repeat-associated protein